jgi:hypothetical protein
MDTDIIDYSCGDDRIKYQERSKITLKLADILKGMEVTVFKSEEEEARQFILDLIKKNNRRESNF